ncbi:MAG: YjzC family protein [Clostridia bacterium]
MKYKSGETAPKTGSYNVVDQSGKVKGKVDIQKGQTLPPTQTDKEHFEM